MMNTYIYTSPALHEPLRAPLRCKKASIAENAKETQSYAGIENKPKNPSAALSENLCGPLRYKKASIAENAKETQSYAEIENKSKNPSVALRENLRGPLRYKKVSIAENAENTQRPQRTSAIQKNHYRKTFLYPSRGQLRYPSPNQ